jgi:hypothetical protein
LGFLTAGAALIAAVVLDASTPKKTVSRATTLVCQ